MSVSGRKRAFVQAPGPALRPFVRRLLVVEYPSGHRDTHLPDTGFVAAFRLRGECVLNGATPAPDAALTGLWNTSRSHDHRPGHMVALVQFTAVGAAAILRRPLDDFCNTTVALADVLGRRPVLHDLSEQLALAPNHGRRMQLLEEFLLGRIGTGRPDVLVSAAVSWIERAGPEARVEALVQHIGLSQSALERRFRRHVGVSPRQFASLVRLQHILRLRRAGQDFTSIAHAAGYFDQSHFIKDFKRFAGRAPDAYFAGAAG
ncbi:MAG TPA: helix-turn-helix transcriptional regulator [Candidatus Didemnitutus sp.]|nr:helix-turn-helix transcriptional regulator [Candidatus Didemnitutus sp.]